MSLRRILMRHAKSNWHLTLSDHALPLNNRGRRAASALGEWLSRNGYVPNEIISSTAARTLETCARLNLGKLPSSTQDLYLDSHDTLLETLRSATGQTGFSARSQSGDLRLCKRASEHPASPPTFW